jgi:hypothetical protein
MVGSKEAVLADCCHRPACFMSVGAMILFLEKRIKLLKPFDMFFSQGLKSSLVNETLMSNRKRLFPWLIIFFGVERP